jgi:hypothetical protein
MQAAGPDAIAKAPNMAAIRRGAAAQSGLLAADSSAPVQVLIAIPASTAGISISLIAVCSVRPGEWP